MRHCTRCQAEMITNFDLNISQDSRLKLVYECDDPNKPGKVSIADVNIAVCTKCGNIEFYTNDLQRINEVKERISLRTI